MRFPLGSVRRQLARRRALSWVLQRPWGPPGPLQRAVSGEVKAWGSLPAPGGIPRQVCLRSAHVRTRRGAPAWAHAPLQGTGPLAAGTLAGAAAFSPMDMSRRMQRCPRLRRTPVPIASGPCLSCKNTLAAWLLGPVLTALAGDLERGSLKPPLSGRHLSKYFLQDYHFPVVLTSCQEELALFGETLAKRHHHPLALVDSVVSYGLQACNPERTLGVNPLKG